MQYLILAIALVGSVFGQYGYQPGYQQAYKPKPYQPQYYSHSPAKFIGIKSEYKDSKPDGSYSYSYESENGISVAESGQSAPHGHAGSVQGKFSYHAPDGTPIAIAYTADEHGFRAKGAHIPTPPPIPEAIKKALEANPQGDDDSKYNYQPYQQKYQGSIYSNY